MTRWKERAHLAEGAVAVLNGTIDDLNSEVDRLTKERDEMRSHLIRANRNAVAFMDENEWLTADRHARDVAMVKAGIEAAAREMRPMLRSMLSRGTVADAIRAIDPEAVLKAMEEGR